MHYLDLLPGLECLSLIICAILNPLERGCLKPKQHLDAVEDDLSLSYMGVRPEWLTSIINSLWLGGVDIIDVPPKLTQQAAWLSEAGLLRINLSPTQIIRL